MSAADSESPRTGRPERPGETTPDSDAPQSVGRPRMTAWLWATFLAAGVTLALAYELVPLLHQTVVFNLLCLSS